MNKETEIIDKRLLRSAATKKKILLAAKDVFLEEGFQKTTISEIMKRASVGYGTAYVHFKGKDDILIVLMEDVMQSFYQIAETPFNPKSKKEAKCMIERQAYDFLKLAEGERAVLKVFNQAIGVSDMVSRKWKSIREKFIEGITNDIAKASHSGLVRLNFPHKVIARSWFYMNEMHLWEIVEEENTEPVEEIALSITEVYVSGLYISQESETY